MSKSEKRARGNGRGNIFSGVPLPVTLLRSVGFPVHRSVLATNFENCDRLRHIIVPEISFAQAIRGFGSRVSALIQGFHLMLGWDLKLGCGFFA